MAAHTKVVPNNCVSVIEVPRKVGRIYCVDYNPVLGLYATFNYDGLVSVWNPVSGKVVAEFSGFGENFVDVLFVPGNRLAVSSSEANHGGSIEIFNLENSNEFVKRDDNNDEVDKDSDKEDEVDEQEDKDEKDENDDIDDKEDEEEDKDEKDDKEDEEEGFDEEEEIKEEDNNEVNQDEGDEYDGKSANDKNDRLNTDDDKVDNDEDEDEDEDNKDNEDDKDEEKDQEYGESDNDKHDRVETDDDINDEVDNDEDEEEDEEIERDNNGDDENDQDDEISEDDSEEEEEHCKAEFVIKDIQMSYPGPIALSPGGNLLVADALCGSAGVDEIFIDWDNSKFIKSREICPGDEDAESGVGLLCCSLNFQVSTFTYEPPMLLCTTVFLNSEGEVHVDSCKQEKITYYLLNGKEESVGKIYGLVHDGQNLIIASEDEIVLLESMTEGSTAHLIASDVKLSGQMRLNHEGQLIVCEEKVIKLFDYKCEPRSLQELCRSHFRKSIFTGYIDKVNSLEIPSLLKNYLLFK